ncbi:hypothetical protein HG531_003138 [Fusarium graminearum]|nr:hypothetical protein HG531_003138 [Fusarium graminearum]
MASSLILSGHAVGVATILESRSNLDSLDSVGNVGEVDESTALFAQGVDKFNLAILGEVLSQSLLSPGLIEITDVDVSGSTSADSQGNGWGKSSRMLAPANLETSVVDHKTLDVAEGVERCSCGRVDEGNKTDMLVGDVTDVMKKSATDNITNLLNRRLGVDVAQVDGSVTEVVNTTSSRGDSSGSNRLLSKGVRDQVAISTCQHVGVPRSNTQVLSSVLLLRLGDIGTAILAVIHTTRSLPFGLLRELRDCLDGVGDRKVVHERNVLLADNLDRVNCTELTKILSQFLL